MVPLEILDGFILIANSALLVYYIKHNKAAPQPTPAEKPSVAEKILSIEPCDHWGSLRFGGREEVAGKHRTIVVCDKCNASRVVEEA